MKEPLLSVPDVISIVIHQSARHRHDEGIACVGGNIDTTHERPFCVTWSVSAAGLSPT